MEKMPPSKPPDDTGASLHNFVDRMAYVLARFWIRKQIQQPEESEVQDKETDEKQE